MNDQDLAQLATILRRHADAAHDIGLILAADLKASGYDATPECCATFAWTGGDGVHFSLADLGEKGTPVVMTVPMEFDTPNLVVGQDLRDFLSLGLWTGYFTLEQLVYDRADALANRDACDLGGPAHAALLDLCTSFDLTPWTDISGRLDWLQIEFSEALA